ncbi:MAG: hypothetical protein JWQ43_1846 [Glaciihabitans sp.]|nr:hypothetical protein [Glaciihabitans sp.]
MPDEAVPRFDPRFNPAFQPGYDPASDVADSVPTAPTARTSALAPASDRTAQSSTSTAWSSSPLEVSSRPTPVGVPAAGQYSPGQYSPGPAPARPSVPEVRAPEPLAPPAGVVFDDASTAYPDVQREEDDSTTRGLLRNPFLIGLAVLAAVFVAIGVWLFNSAYEASSDATSFSSTGDYQALGSVMNAAPFVVLFGAAIAVSVLFVFATRWRSRR